jgi:hypothetical protein
MFEAFDLALNAGATEHALAGRPNFLELASRWSEIDEPLAWETCHAE